MEDIAHGLIKEKRFGFEEVAYLLLSGKLPDKEELAGFKELICDNMPLEQKTKMNILDLEGQNIMNILARSVLEMYTFDPNPDDTSRDNLMRQSIELISRFRPSSPMLTTFTDIASKVVRCISATRMKIFRSPKTSFIC